MFLFMPKRKYTRSQRKHIRKEKARIRREFFSLKKQEEEIEKVFDKISGKLQQTRNVKVQSKTAKKAPVDKKSVKSKIKIENKKNENK